MKAKATLKALFQSKTLGATAVEVLPPCEAPDDETSDIQTPSSIDKAPMVLCVILSKIKVIPRFLDK
jgi:hypothetical protein